MKPGIQETNLFTYPRGKNPNSRAAYRTEKPRLTIRASEILDDIKDRGPGTDRQIKERMGFADMNNVRPRINDLIKLGLVQKYGNQIDKTTNKRVRVVGIAQPEEKP